MRSKVAILLLMAALLCGGAVFKRGAGSSSGGAGVDQNARDQLDAIQTTNDCVTDDNCGLSTPQITSTGGSLGVVSDTILLSPSAAPGMIDVDLPETAAAVDARILFSNVDGDDSRITFQELVAGTLTPVSGLAVDTSARNAINAITEVDLCSTESQCDLTTDRITAPGGITVNVDDDGSGDESYTITSDDVNMLQCNVVTGCTFSVPIIPQAPLPEVECFPVQDPNGEVMDSYDFESVWRPTFPGEIVSAWCDSDGTVTMDVQHDDGTPADVVGTDLVCVAAGDEDLAPAGSTTFAAGDRFDFAITSVSGSPNRFTFCLGFERS